jgi:hypothetical protein
MEVEFRPLKRCSGRLSAQKKKRFEKWVQLTQLEPPPTSPDPTLNGKPVVAHLRQCAIGAWFH